jgi:hypothetical protein
MIAEHATRLIVQSYFLKSVSNRIMDTIPELPKEALENLPLAVLLSLLFLLRGEWGSPGDYMSTQKGLRSRAGRDIVLGQPPARGASAFRWVGSLKRSPRTDCERR